MYTRRQFLQLAGIALAGSQLSPILSRFEAQAAEPHPFQARALEVANIHSHPDSDAAIVKRLWPDSVSPIIEPRGEWYRLADGFAPRTSLQPMKPPLAAPLPTATIPFWAEVTAPAAPVRAYCGADAPLVTRVGHGGILQVIEFLPGEPASWYGVASEQGKLLGWTESPRWSPLHWTQEAPTRTTIELDTRLQRITLGEDGAPALQAPCSIGRDVLQGTYRVGERQPGRSLHTDGNLTLFGVPWRVMFSDYDIFGAYWHNRFGDRIPGRSIQVTPVMAELLYTAVRENDSIIVVQ